MKKYTGITARYLKVQKKRTILTIIGIILSVALITGVGTIIVSMRDIMIRDQIKQSGDYHVEFRDVAQDKVNFLQNHVETRSSGLTTRVGDVIIAQVDEKVRKFNKKAPPHKFLTIEAFSSSAMEILQLKLTGGRLPKAPDEIIVDLNALEEMPGKPRVGDKITVELGDRRSEETGKIHGVHMWSADEVFEKRESKEYTIVGVSNPGFISSSAFGRTAITFLDENSTQPGRNYNVYVKMKSVKNVHEKAEKAAADAGIPVEDEEGSGLLNFNEPLLRLSAESMSDSLNNSMKMMLIFIVSLIIISTVAVIYNSFNISVLERVSQFGILRCVGASPSQIRGIVLREAFVLSVIGIPIGILSGTFAMSIVFSIVNSLSRIFANLDLRVSVSPSVLVISIVLGLLTIFLSAYGPARKAGRVSPLDAVRNTGSLKKGKIQKVKKARLLGLLLGVEGQIAWKNLRRNRKRFVITVFSMVISIVLFIVFGSFMDYAFKIGVASDEMPGDFVIWKNSGNMFTQEDYEKFKGLPGIEIAFKHMRESAGILVPKSKINPRFAEIRSEMLQEKRGDSVVLHNNEIKCYGDEALPELKKLLKSGSIDRDAMNRDNGVILVKTGKIYNRNSERTALIDVADFNIGDNIRIIPYIPENFDDVKAEGEGDEKTSDTSSEKNVKVVAILEKDIPGDDYNINGGINIITTEEVFGKLTGSNKYNNITMRLAKDADKEPVSKYLKELNEKDPKYNYIDIAEQAREQRNIQIIISIFLYGFVAVITLIGCLNIINTISTNLLLRTRELSVLKAVGMTQGGIKKMVGYECVYYGLIAAFYGGIAGTVLSYVLFGITSGIREFQWAIPWGRIFIAVSGAVLVALMSSYVPLKKINSGVIVDKIRMEE